MEIDSSRYEPHVQLHGFSDASERAYAMVVYVRSNYNDGQFEVRLVASKTKSCTDQETDNSSSEIVRSSNFSPSRKQAQVPLDCS